MRKTILPHLIRIAMPLIGTLFFLFLIFRKAGRYEAFGDKHDILGEVILFGPFVLIFGIWTIVAAIREIRSTRSGDERSDSPE